MTRRRVVVVGAGGREHALARALGATAEVVVTPGNPGIPGSVAAPGPVEELAADLYVIGPEAPLVEGLADRLRAKGALVFGPGADGARLEGSKAFMKEVVAAAGVPTARYAAFGADEVEAAFGFLDGLAGGYVVKTDGLAAGKGVLVSEDLGEARADVAEKVAGGRRVVIEERLAGLELSVLLVCDGRRVVPLPPARDHKRVGDGDTGPNTGGMGAFSPVAEADEGLVDEVVERFAGPTLAELRRRGIDYRGVLYAGLMLTPEGPKLLEYNVRFGDPEAQVVVPRVDADLVDLLAAAAAGDLGAMTVSPRPETAVAVVAAVPGYPAAPTTGAAIEGLDAAAAVPGVHLDFAGVACDREGRLVTAGGRVLAATAVADTVADARARAYEAVAHLSWPGIHYRTDIAATPS